jgi:hypothetical protein
MSVTDSRRTGRSGSGPWVGRGPELSEQTVAHIGGALEASHSEGTRRVYASDWRRFRAWCARSLYPTDVQPAIVCDNYSPHLTARKCCRVADWAEANNVEIAYDGTDRASHHEQSRL